MANKKNFGRDTLANAGALVVVALIGFGGIALQVFGDDAPPPTCGDELTSYYELYQKQPEAVKSLDYSGTELDDQCHIQDFIDNLQ